MGKVFTNEELALANVKLVQDGRVEVGALMQELGAEAGQRGNIELAWKTLREEGVQLGELVKNGNSKIKRKVGPEGAATLNDLMKQAAEKAASKKNKKGTPPDGKGATPAQSSK